jgi:hypothetical protein
VSWGGGRIFSAPGYDYISGFPNADQHYNIIPRDCHAFLAKDIISTISHFKKGTLRFSRISPAWLLLLLTLTCLLLLLITFLWLSVSVYSKQVLHSPLVYFVIMPLDIMQCFTKLYPQVIGLVCISTPLHAAVNQLNKYWCLKSRKSNFPCYFWMNTLITNHYFRRYK